MKKLMGVSSAYNWVERENRSSGFLSCGGQGDYVHGHAPPRLLGSFPIMKALIRNVLLGFIFTVGWYSTKGAYDGKLI